MADTNDAIRKTLVANLLSPWVALAFCVGFGVGYVAKAIVG
jgi:hypothetical protein